MILQAYASCWRGGILNIPHSFSLSRPAWLFAALLALTLAALALFPSHTHANSPPATPGAVTVTRADGTLTASWDAVEGALSYHVTYTSDGKQSWSLGAFAHTGATITISGADNSKTYFVAVRARNDGGWSGWRDSAAAGPYTPPTTPTPTPSPTPTPTPSPTPTPYPLIPTPPASVTVTRSDGALHVTWPAVGVPTESTSYHVTYAIDEQTGRTWSLAALNHPTNSITISPIWNDEIYIVGVRARNSAGDSAWTNSPFALPYSGGKPKPEAPASVTATRGNHTISASWPAVENATHYHVCYGSPTETYFEHCESFYSGTSITWNRDVLRNHGEYHVGVLALNGNGESDWTESAVLPAWIPRVASVNVTRSDGKLHAVWNAASGATSYHVTYAVTDTHSWSLAAYNHASTSVDVRGVDNAKKYIVAVRVLHPNGWSVWRNSAPVPVYTPPAPTPTPTPPPPAAPENLAVAPGDGFLDITWDASGGADSYDVRVKAENSTSWISVATGVTGTSYRYNTTQTIDYLAVRARNAGGTSGWTQVSRLPPSELLNTATGVTAQSGGLVMATAQSGAGQSEGASGQSNDVSAQAQLSAPAWGAITRNNNRLKGELNLNWTHSGWATGYNIVCSDTDGWTWNVCGWVDSTERAVYTTVPTTQSKPIKVTHYRRGSGSYGTPGDYALSRFRHYMVAIRAVNANPADASPWVNSEIIRPISGHLTNIRYTRTDSQITLSWDSNYWTTGYTIYCGTYDSTQSPYVAPTTVCATLTNQDDTQARHSVTLTSWTGGSIDNTSTWDIHILSTNKWGEDGIFAPLIAPNPSLTAGSVTSTSTTLTVANHTGNWWYRGKTLSGSLGSCTAGSGSSVTLTGLESSTQYEYKLYSASTCDAASLIASTSFRTHPSGSGPAFSVTNVTNSTARLTLSNHTGNWWYKGGNRSLGQGDCTAGPSNFILNLSGLNSDTEYSYRAYSDSSCGTEMTSTTFRTQPTYALSVSNIGATTATLNITGHGAQWWYKATTAPDNTCQGPVAANTAYKNLSGLTSGNSYTYSAYSATGCANTNLLATAAAFTTTKSLTVSSIATTTATLTIDGHTAQWWYKANTGPHTTCQGPVAANTATKALSGLTAGSTYTYSAYSATGCANTNLLATAAQFTTDLTLSVSGVTSSGATLTLYGQSGSWWYQGGEVGETLGSCTSAPSGNSVTLSGLDYSEEHEYSAYSASGCDATDIIATVRFSTKSANSGPALTPTNVSRTTARLTLSGRAGGWWYRGGSRAIGMGNCTEGPQDYVLHLSSLDKNTDYTYRAYSDSLCATQIATITFRTQAGPVLTVSNIATSTAKLTISNHTAQWWYKANNGAAHYLPGAGGVRHGLQGPDRADRGIALRL